MKIDVFQAPRIDTNDRAVQPLQMNRGGDVDLEAFMGSNPVVAEAVETNTPATTTTFSDRGKPSRPNLSFADAYALWQQSKPEAPRRPRGMGAASKSYQAARKKFERDYAAWEASEPNFRDFGPSQQEETTPDRGPSPMDSDDFAERFATGQLTGAEIQRLIEDGTLSEEQVQTLIANYQLSEDQLAQLYSQGLLTEDQIREIIGQEIGEAAEEEAAEGLAGLTEEQVNELVQQGLAGLDMSNYATQEDIQGLEALFQN